MLMDEGEDWGWLTNFEPRLLWVYVVWREFTFFVFIIPNVIDNRGCYDWYMSVFFDILNCLVMFIVLLCIMYIYVSDICCLDLCFNAEDKKF